MASSVLLYDVQFSKKEYEHQQTSVSSRQLQEILKRVADICIALCVLTLISPLLILVICWIRIGMGGPVFFGHRRVGRYGQPFRCYKFRSMVQNSSEILTQYLASHPEAAAEWQATRKLKHDPRITRLGRFLRASSIDELPQLFNVLAGDMSCVGPRPIVFDELERYGAAAGRYLTVRPGLTGLWQVNGRSSVTYKERVALDMQYIRDWSIWLDLMILLKTPPAVFKYRHTA